jgi:hypothetical protein
MADGVAITPGSGVTVATEEVTTLNGASVSARQVQHVDLVAITADGVASSLAKGSGASGNTVLRVVSASDDPAVALLGTIDTDTGAMVADLAAIEVLLTTIDGRVDTLETLIGTTNTNTAAATTALQLIDNAVSGNELQVDVVAALPTGTNSIGAVTNTHLTNALIGDYETVAASQTNQVLGATGGTGDYLAGVLIVPATTSPGNVIILDNATSITIFTGGASSVSNLVPFMVPLGMLSVSGSWRITTGANVSAVGIGNFT